MGETSCFTAGIDLAPLSMIDNNDVGLGPSGAQLVPPGNFMVTW